jgi:hypothetical protein
VGPVNGNAADRQAGGLNRFFNAPDVGLILWRVITWLAGAIVKMAAPRLQVGNFQFHTVGNVLEQILLAITQGAMKAVRTNADIHGYVSFVNR